MVTGRFVVLLCGPPGAGKTTTAHESGLLVLDSDDEHWESQRHFTEAMAAIGQDPDARAVVIRSGATSTARAKAAALIGPTHTYVLTAPERELNRRVARRGRAEARNELAGIRRWLTTHDRDDGVQDFPGWDLVREADRTTASPAGLTIRAW